MLKFKFYVTFIQHIKNQEKLSFWCDGKRFFDILKIFKVMTVQFFNEEYLENQQRCTKFATDKI